MDGKVLMFRFVKEAKNKKFNISIHNKIAKIANPPQRAESLLSSDLTFPEGIAVDWISRNIYFTGDI